MTHLCFCLQDYVHLDDAQVSERFVAVEDRKRRLQERRDREARQCERKSASRRQDDAAIQQEADTVTSLSYNVVVA